MSGMNALVHEYEVGETPNDDVGVEGVLQSDWVGPWTLNAKTLTWERTHKHRDYKTGELTGMELPHQGEMVRPGVLRDVVHLDVPLAALHSHDDTPGALPEDKEGMWIDTNPSWPEDSVRAKVSEMGLEVVWADCSPDIREYAIVGDRFFRAVVTLVKPV